MAAAANPRQGWSGDALRRFLGPRLTPFMVIFLIGRFLRASRYFPSSRGKGRHAPVNPSAGSLLVAAVLGAVLMSDAVAGLLLWVPVAGTAVAVLLYRWKLM